MRRLDVIGQKGGRPPICVSAASQFGRIRERPALSSRRRSANFSPPRSLGEVARARSVAPREGGWTRDRTLVSSLCYELEAQHLANRRVYAKIDGRAACDGDEEDTSGIAIDLFS